MNLKLNVENALESATDIESTIQSMTAAMEQLNSDINKYIPEQIQTNWSASVKENWGSYYTNDVPEAMAQMNLSATNLKAAVEAAVRNSQGY